MSLHKNHVIIHTCKSIIQELASLFFFCCFFYHPHPKTFSMWCMQLLMVRPLQARTEWCNYVVFPVMIQEWKFCPFESVFMSTSKHNTSCYRNLHQQKEHFHFMTLRHLMCQTRITIMALSWDINHQHLTFSLLVSTFRDKIIIF